MDARFHALLSRRLIAECGGVDEIVRANACRVSRPQLYRYSNPDEPDCMPADVMACLEAYCGTPVYSRALAEERPHNDRACDLADEGCKVTEASASMQAQLRLALKDGILSPRERTRLALKLLELETHVRALRAGFSDAGPAGGGA